MAENPTQESVNALNLAAFLAECTIGGDSSTQTSQIQHRLNILSGWFGSLDDARNPLQGKSILEVGCGQGDMTVPLAHMCKTDQVGLGSVSAVDPASPSYGAPFTIGRSQECISKSNIGPWIEWIQRDSLEYLEDMSKTGKCPDIMTFAHSIWYLPSEQYFSEVLQAFARVASKRDSSRPVRLLLAEWGMRQSDETSRGHTLAVEIQEESPWKSGNIQTVMRPEKIRQAAEYAGWKLEKEEWIASPDVEDGKWEVANVKRSIDPGKLSERARQKFDEMTALSSGGTNLGSMDVWTAVFQCPTSNRE